MCKVLDVSRSGYYKWKTAPPPERVVYQERLSQRIKYHFEDNKKRLGSPRITRELRKEGLTVSVKTVARIMKKLGLISCMTKRYKVTTTISDPNHIPTPNILNRQFKVTTPNKVWVTDITYIHTRQGMMYLASVLDLCTRKIVGWSFGDRMTQDLVITALDKAYEAKLPPPGLLHHSDRGAQYTSNEYRAKLSQYGMISSMSRKGDCYDNAVIESWHSTLKKELIYPQKFKTKTEAHEEMYEYIEYFYNRKRSHSSLGYISPDRFEAQFYANKSNL